MDVNWRPPRWVKYSKHLPAKITSWSQVVASTAGTYARSQYGPHPTINERVIEGLEMLAVAEPQGGTALPEGVERGELPAPQSNLRTYWIRLPFIVGASEGQETRYAFVMRSPNGEVHGYPMRRERLMERGMPDNV